MLLNSSVCLLNIKSDNYIPLGVSCNFKPVFPVFDIFPLKLIIRLIDKENITINDIIPATRLRLKSVNNADISI
jgi:hypothetical protein